MKTLKTNREENTKTTKTITEYASVTIEANFVENNVVPDNPYGSAKFNKNYTYSTLGFCTSSEAYKLNTLNFRKLTEVFNFLNNKWGWKIHSIVPIVKTERHTGYSSPMYWDETKTTDFVYTFYREVEK